MPVDFGDLLLHTIDPLHARTQDLARYQRQFRYLLVDEYQDTNVAQYLWLRLLARRSIETSAASAMMTNRSMAGAGPRSETFSASSGFSGAKVVRLERNYRSNAHILAAASGLIAHNEGRLGKTLWTEEAEGREGDAARRLEARRKRGWSARRSRRAAQRRVRSAPSRSWCARVFRPASSKSGSSPWACRIA